MVICLIFAVLGCKAKENGSTDLPDNKKADLKIISAAENDPRTSEYKTKLKEFAYDFDLDNEDEKIELYTAAERNAKGEMLWDDGQNWLLVVVDKDKCYSLLSGYVQLGQVYFRFSTSGEEKTPVVTAFITDQCGMNITDYIFDKEKQCFQVKVIHEAYDKNVYYTSIPDY